MTIAEQGPLHRGTLGYGTFADTYGDDPYDQAMIQLGYDYYNKTHRGIEVSFFDEIINRIDIDALDKATDIIADVLDKIM